MAFDWVKYCESKYPDYMTLDQLRVYVERGKISIDDFERISGQSYST